MLPKVSAALSKFVAPIASSNSEQARRDPQREGQGRKNFRVIKGGPASPPEASATAPASASTPAIQKFEPKRLDGTLDDAPDDAGASAPTAAPAAAPPAVRSHSLTPGQVLLQLMAALDLKKGFAKLLGRIAYRSAIRNQKTSGRVRKGAVLDEKVE